MMKRSLSLTALSVFFTSSVALASGPLNTNPNDPAGVERWPNGGANIPFNPDGVPAGGPDASALGPFTYTEAVALVEAALARWEGIPSATATYQNNGPLSFDVTVDNYFPFVENLFFGLNNSDGLSPIVFDDDGSIFVDLFGVSGVLGFASTDTRDADGNPIEAVCFLNGGSIDGGFPAADFEGVIFHEFGHYSGLGHTVVNGQNVALGDTSGPSPNNTYGNSPGDQVETMYPFAIVGGGQVDPHADDIGFFSFLYPSTTFFAESGTIQGRILAADGTPLTGVNVIARNVANPFVDAVSAISGDRPAPGSTAGDFTINGLTPGAQYTVHVDQIQQGGFSTPPIELPGPEEFYNGANESNNQEVPDDPAEATEITVAAGAPVTGIDVIFNAPVIREGVPLPIGDEEFVQIVTDFPMALCGTTYNSLFVHDNGFITFGEGIPGFTFFESAAGMLSGPPRIAAVWDDLDLRFQGTATFETTSNSITIKYENVPQFLNSDSNNFEIKIFKAPSGDNNNSRDSRFEIRIGELSLTDGLTGYSCGGGITTGAEPPVDLSEQANQIETKDITAIYEVFSSFGSTNDLAGTRLRFKGTKPFRDLSEPNDSPAEATPVALPFNNADVFNAISPIGGDVDFFSFNAEAGTTLIAEVLNGALDSTLGLYRITRTPTGEVTAELVTADDDGGAGLLSRILFPIQESGEYAIAVSAFPDFDFTGDGASGGRYVLDVQSIEGLLLNLGDDNFVEFDLGFSFPFNGQTYSSVFINSNGNLTFGVGSTDFSESVGELLGGPPRIAALYDDLSPNQGGLVIVDSTATSFSVTFQNVPEFFASTTNTFSVTLLPSGAINVAYGDIAATDGIAGVSEGGGVADPGPTDLSAAASLSAVGTTYEAFGFSNANDLDNVTLDYQVP